MKILTFIFAFFLALHSFAQPSEAAPTPTRAADDVISLFSNAYTNVPVDTWRTDWSAADLADIEIQGNSTKRYTNLDFVGIETVANQIDITGMTHMHMNIWTPNLETFLIKLVDFGSNGIFDGPGQGDDTEGTIVLENPTRSQWLSVNIPLAQFSGLANKRNIAQLILACTPVGQGTVYLDNVYFYYQEPATLGEPTTAAPTPTRDSLNVISMYSDAYNDVRVDTWRTEWSAAELEDIEILGNATKKYSKLDFVGIETVANQIDITGMTHMHIDVWTPNLETFLVKLVDFGPNGTFDGPGEGDDTEGTFVLTNPTRDQWLSLDIPLAQFGGLANKRNIAQLILACTPVGEGVVYLDNVYFYYQEPTPLGEPMTAAPTPTRDEANVISMYSDAYTDIPVDTWRTEWSAADLEDIEIQGNPTKKYSKLDFVGIETVANQIDISGMTHMHMDVWTPNLETFLVKLVDFGPNGTFDGPGQGDDTEGTLVLENPTRNEWLRLDIPLAQFEGLANRRNIAQLILACTPVGEGIVYVDNVYFYNAQSGPTEPMTAAPTPTRNAAGVISMYSDVYNDVPVDTWRTEWSAADLEDIEIQGNPTKKYSNLDFVGIETVANQIDITGMTHMHMNIWTPNMTLFRVKLVDFGPNGIFDGGDDTEHEIVVENPGQGEWLSLDVPLTQFANLTNRKNIAQLILSGLPVGGGTVFVDNVYFYDVTSNTENIIGSKLKVYPNPAISGEIIRLDGDIYKFEIISINGQQVMTGFGNVIKTASLQTGVYVLKAAGSNGKIYSEKLIIK